MIAGRRRVEPMACSTDSNNAPLDKPTRVSMWFCLCSRTLDKFYQRVTLRPFQGKGCDICSMPMHQRKTVQHSCSLTKHGVLEAQLNTSTHIDHNLSSIHTQHRNTPTCRNTPTHVPYTAHPTDCSHTQHDTLHTTPTLQQPTNSTHCITQLVVSRTHTLTVPHPIAPLNVARTHPGHTRHSGSCSESVQTFADEGPAGSYHLTEVQQHQAAQHTEADRHTEACLAV